MGDISAKKKTEIITRVETEHRKNSARDAEVTSNQTEQREYERSKQSKRSQEEQWARH